MQATLVGMKVTLVAAVVAAAMFLGGSLLPGAAPESAHAQNEQDGLINVVIEDSLNNLVTIEDVNVGVGANIAANVCNVNVGPIAVLARTVDRSGTSVTACEAGGNTVTLEQN